MDSSEHPHSSTCAAQEFLLDRDAGLLCRILGLYAARGLDLAFVRYSCAEQSVMRLEVGLVNTSPEVVESTRVLVEKAMTFVGILAAVELTSDSSHST